MALNPTAFEDGVMNGFSLHIEPPSYAIIGHTRADQLLPQLLMEHFDTLPIQCRHIEHMREGVYFTKNIF